MAAVQQSLFDDYEGVSPTQAVIPIVKIMKNDDKATKKRKNMFNSRMRAIKKLREEIKNFDGIAAELNALYQQKVVAHENSVNEARLNLMEAIDKAYQKKSFSESERGYLRNEMMDHLNIFQREHADIDYSKFEKYFDEVSEGFMQDEFTLELMKEMMKEATGAENVDPKDFVGENKLSEEELAEKYFSQKEEETSEEGSAEEAYSDPAKEAPKGKKNDKRVDDMLENNFSKKYKQLAKRIHPDLEPNDEIKKQKEELMTELALAKETKDLYQLISIQAKVDQIEFGENKIDEKYLEEINSYLMDQKKELESDLYMLKNHSGMNSFLYQTFYHHTSRGKVNKIAKYIEELNDKEEALIETAEQFKTVKSTKEWIRYGIDNEDIYDFPIFF